MNEKSGRVYKRPARKRGGKPHFVRIIAVLAIIAAAAVVSLFLVDRYMPNYRVVPPNEYYSDWSDGIIVDGEDQISGFKSLEVDGETYIPFEFVKASIDKYAFWDAAERRLTLTTAEKVVRFTADGEGYYENEVLTKLEHPLHFIDDSLYIPADLLAERYGTEISRASDYGVTLVLHTAAGISHTEVKSKKTALRYEPNIKSPIAQDLVMGDRLVVFGDDGGYSKVRSEHGVIGYVRTDAVNEVIVVPPAAVTEPVINYAKPLTGKITLLWDQVTNVQANSEPLRRQNIDGVDVLSPTWFSFDAEKLNGDIISVADKAYVEYAHANGYQVWALITDNFSGEVSHAAVSSTSTREHVIDQLLGYVDTYKLDGINIDFEAVRKDDAEAYLQFVRELAPALHNKGVYLSVDMYVPSPWSMYYNRAEVGKAADFICVMTYDEHYAGSPVSGPVASINFVDSGVADTLDEVPKEKILMGMPFYARVWREERVEPGEPANVSSSAYSMEAARGIFERNNAEFIWLADTGCYYAEYQATEDGKQITYKVWLEDEHSIEQKLKVAEKYDVAGVACWKRGLEKRDVWALISNYIQ